MLRLFPNTMTPNDKYYLLHGENFKQPSQMHLTQKEQNFSKFFVHFCVNFTVNFELFQKKITLIADVFPKLQTPKEAVR